MKKLFCKKLIFSSEIENAGYKVAEAILHPIVRGSYFDIGTLDFMAV